VSDLQCPARVFLARHGDTAYESELLMDHGGSLTPTGRAQARELGARLRSERIAHVYTSTLSRAVQTAELAAAALGLEVTVREGLVELKLGEAIGTPADSDFFDAAVEGWVGGDTAASAPGSESAVDIATRVRTVLDDLADRHRGEAVLVVSHAYTMVATLSVLDFAPGRPTYVPNCGFAQLEGDADGWRVVAEVAAVPLG
jgi:2,3-bisphosphoglycerate-dependent phosphoglycerate mutase